MKPCLNNQLVSHSLYWPTYQQTGQFTVGFSLWEGRALGAAYFKNLVASEQERLRLLSQSRPEAWKLLECCCWVFVERLKEMNGSSNGPTGSERVGGVSGTQMTLSSVFSPAKLPGPWMVLPTPAFSCCLICQSSPEMSSQTHAEVCYTNLLGVSQSSQVEK